MFPTTPALTKAPSKGIIGPVTSRAIGHLVWTLETGEQVVVESEKEAVVMTLAEILQDIHAAEEDLLVFERKYGILTETFYRAYQHGEEPEDDAWVLDWSEWAGTYEILLELQERYRQAVETLLQTPDIPSVARLIGHTARHESLTVAG